MTPPLNDNTDLPTIGTYDIVVCGGGTAGWVAALSARRAGKRVAIIERMSQIGGIGTSGLVCHWLGGRTTDTQHWVVGGIFRETVREAVAEGIAVLPQLSDYHDVPYTPYGQMKGSLIAGVPYDPLLMTCLIERKLLDAGVDILLQSQVVECQVIDQRLHTLVVAGKQGLCKVIGEVFVDSTGDADVATRAGCAYVQGDELDGDIAGVTFMLQLDNVDEARFMAAMIAEDDPRQRKRIARLREEGLFPFPIPIFVFIKLNTPGCFMVNGNWAPGKDATDTRWRSQALLELRGRIPHLIHLFNEHFPGLEQCRLRTMATDLGVRETRRIEAIHRMTVAEVQANSPCSDAIGFSAYNWDLGGSRQPDVQPMHGQPAPAVIPIPYGIMVPRDIDNVICAGRSVCVERQVLGPLRVMAPVMAMGEAAGLAAAQAIDARVSFSDLNTDGLRQALRQQGAIVDFEAIYN